MRQITLLLSTAAFVLTASHADAGIKGSVGYKGKVAAPKALDMSSDPKCAKLSAGAKSNDLVVNGGKVRDVFVYVKNAPKGKYKAKSKPVLDQKGCLYIPKVLGVMTKQKFDIVNSDPTLHNVHAFAKRGEFNQAMPKQGQRITKKFKKEQVMVPIKCDVHSWMQAYVGVLPHPFFATTGEDGSFDIDASGLADGEYELAFWHAKLGEKTTKVKVAGGNASADFSY